MIKILVRLILFSILLIVAGFLFIIFQYPLYRIWAGIISPRHHVFQVESSRRIAFQIQPDAEGIEWLGSRWSDDGKQIEIYNSRSQVYAQKLLTINAENGAIVVPVKTFKRGEIPGLISTLPFVLDNKETLWGGCSSQNIFLSGKEIAFNQWEPRLWKDGQLIKSFQPIEYYPARDPDPIGLIMEFSTFTPDCRYFAWSNSRRLWLLDTTKNSFVPLINARTLIFPDIDHPRQYMEVDWSPSDNEFVFGDSVFGIEAYKIDTNKRSWLLDPSFTGYSPDWSSSGKWISVVRDNRHSVTIVSPDGKKISTLETCVYIEDPSWSPVDDRIAFICSVDNDKKNLVIWDLSNLDGN